MWIIRWQGWQRKSSKKYRRPMTRSCVRGTEATKAVTAAAQAAANYLNARQYQQALNVLSRIQNRNAQWYYLSAVANMGMGNNVNALNLARQASSMEPGNPEYSNLVNRLQWNSQRYQGGGSPYANNGGSSCGTGNFCCDLWCADSLCECMGGDLCPCM